MGRAIPDRNHELAGVSVICWGISFARKGEPAWIIGVNEDHVCPYFISKSLDNEMGIWCKREEFEINDDEFAKQEIQKAIKMYENILESLKIKLSEYE